MQEYKDPCQIHVQISSADRPGILAEALKSVVFFDWDVLDIKQFVFNGLLNLSLLLGSKKSNSILELQAALEKWAMKTMNLNIAFLITWYFLADTSLGKGSSSGSSI